MSVGNQNLRGAWLVLLAVVVAVVGIIALAGSLAKGQTNHVPVDAQSQLMQPRKLTLEQRVRRLERIVADHEKRLSPTPAVKPASKRSYPYPTDPRSMKQIQREDPELYRDIITTIPAG